MYNWSVNTKTLKKNQKQYLIWKLEQLINFGLKNQKLDINQLKKYFHQLKIDPDKKNYLKLIIYGKKSPLS